MNGQTSEWSQTRLKYLVTAAPGATPSTSDPALWCEPGEGTPWIAIGDMSGRTNVTGTKKALTPEGVASRDMVTGEPGIILFAMYASVGEVARLDVRAVWNQAILGLSPTPGRADGEFLRYLLLSMRPSLARHFRSNTQDNLNAEQVGNLDVTVPPVEFQRRIAEFLDRETAEIDAMIGKQEELVGLLGERRSAVIAHTVTKGLNPNTPMKDTGIDWLGQIPAHWGVKRLSWLFGLISSGTTPANEDQLEDGGDHYWVTTSELRERPIRHTRRMVSSETVEALSPLKLYPPGTLLIAMYGATIGRLGMLEVEACTNQACCAFAEAQGVLPEFAMYALLAAREHLLVLASGGGQPNINQDKLRSLRVPVPPVDEQEALVRHLKEVLDDMDAVFERTQESIELMRERRAALISDAVTGRLDLDTYGRAEQEGVA